MKKERESGVGMPVERRSAADVSSRVTGCVSMETNTRGVVWSFIFTFYSNITVSSWCFYLDNLSDIFYFERSQVKSDLDISSDLK